ncbi:hypothetical protein QF034_000199 [Streptomyces africanus]|uniref:Uncharacterized protein n=1 Tax=Streptomyces africanus TaxID=231024 RepID=A0ABU0QF07_9ACTN|nr:hypothetical protein [Streptomyces africanus]MDQ0745968.1 hypothetical protein [Streptomyces africanus]
MAHDDAIVALLGVKAELARKTGVFGNFAISFSVICNLAGGMSPTTSSPPTPAPPSRAD